MHPKIPRLPPSCRLQNETGYTHPQCLRCSLSLGLRGKRPRYFILSATSTCRVCFCVNSRHSSLRTGSSYLSIHLCVTQPTKCTRDLPGWIHSSQLNILRCFVLPVAYGIFLAVAQVVDFFLHETRSALKDKIMFLLDQNDEPSNELLQGYVREAMRMCP